MQFSEIDIENFRCFGDTSVRFENGVVAVHGSNGAGKSSLLEAVFFALYGSNALPSGVTLDDVLTTGENGASVTLNFRHDGTRYKLTREVRRRGERASNTKSVLRADGPIVADGARDVTGYVTDLLHMDADAFVNCAYIRQGGVTKLINASPSERQAMIDDLLQLGTLEDYRERANEARIGTRRVRDAQAGTVEELDSQIEEQESRNLEQRQATVSVELERIEAAIADLNERREAAVERRDEARELLDAHEERLDRIEEIDLLIEDTDMSIRGAVEEREEEADAIREAGGEAATARSRVRAALAADEETVPTDDIAARDRDALDTDASTVAAGIAHDREAISTEIEEIERQQKEATDAIGEATEERRRAGEAATSLEGEAVNAAESAAAKRDRLAEIEDEIRSDGDALDRLEDEIESEEAAVTECETRLNEFGHDTDDPDTVRENAADRVLRLNERIESVQADIGAAQGHINRATDLRDEGRCPECGQPVDESPHVTRLDDERHAVEHLEAKTVRLRDEREEAKAVAETAGDLASHREALAELRTEIEDVRAECDEKRERVADLETAVENLNDRSIERYREAREKRAEAAAAADRVEEHEAERDRARERIGRLRDLDTALSDLTNAISSVNESIQRRDMLADLREDDRERLHELGRERAELRADVDEDAIDRVERTAAEASDLIDRIDGWNDRLDDMRAERQQSLGLIEGALSDLKQLRERREDAVERERRLRDFYEEVEALEAMYDDVRGDLRRRNIDHLQRIMNDIFDELYRNDVYAGIELDENYAFSVHEKGGDTLDPTQLSGGEQVLFNISLRCAIYKLLARGVRGGGSMPPLILDEPTAHLDTGHVNRLSRIVDIMRDLGVSQTLIVSHDNEIVDSADGEVNLVQDSTTNRSTVATPDIGVP